MGVDISGINPVIKSPKPEMTGDWESLTEDEKSQYFEQERLWEEQNPGHYFGASWWSWRPIVYLIDEASNLFNLGIDTNPFHYNDGRGLETQEECNKLADALEHILNTNEETQKEDAQIYLCTHSWSKFGGSLMNEKECEVLMQSYPPGTLTFSLVVSPNGEIAVPSHSVGVPRVRDFITFLRNCGGFSIF
jgi:hypothetical protein